MWSLTFGLPGLAACSFLLAFEPPNPTAEFGDALQKRVTQRALLDAYAARFHAVEEEIEAQGYAPVPRHRAKESYLRLLRPQWNQAVTDYRLTSQSPVIPHPGFRAPILDAAQERPSRTLDLDQLSPLERKAAELIQEKLAPDGLLLTLTRVIQLLGPETIAVAAGDSMSRLARLGFPVDLLEHFGPTAAETQEPEKLITLLADKLWAGESIESLQALTRTWPFQFAKTHPDFRVAAETGDFEIGLLRLQIGGGYRNGIVRGGSVDVAGQLIGALPQVNFIATVPEEYFENIQWLAVNCWPLRRENQIALISEKSAVTPWAQDNGKAGYIAGEAAASGTPATLAPRYASQQEKGSAYYPGESYLMDGVRAAGHPIVHSPLLFQGGNLLAVQTAPDKRILLVSETEVYRNRELGLSHDQALEALRIEFGVDACQVLPAVSYHLDYDVTIRHHRGEIFAFVNDSIAAARLVLRRGIGAMEQASLLSAETSAAMQQHLEREEYYPVLERLAGVLSAMANEKGQYRTRFIRLFASDRLDSPVQNLRCFFAAMDLLASQTLVEERAPPDSLATQYFAALRDLEQSARRQHDQFRQLGWKVIAVPSMPDLYSSLNYLNGLHDPTCYLMPAMGGFYATVDRAAAEVFQTHLGNEIKVIPILSADLMKSHGGIHCATAAYPRFETPAHPGLGPQETHYP